MATRFYCREAHADMWLETCYSCKTPFAMSDAVHAVALDRKEAFSWWCPNGHSQVYVSGETEKDKLRRERDLLKQQLAQRDDEISRQKLMRQEAEKSGIARKGVITRMKNRAAAGVCPCCNRTVSQMAKHMASKHPTFKAEEVA